MHVRFASAAKTARTVFSSGRFARANSDGLVHCARRRSWPPKRGPIPQPQRSRQPPKTSLVVVATEKSPRMSMSAPWPGEGRILVNVSSNPRGEASRRCNRMRLKGATRQRRRLTRYPSRCARPMTSETGLPSERRSDVDQSLVQGEPDNQMDASLLSTHDCCQAHTSVGRSTFASVHESRGEPALLGGNHGTSTQAMCWSRRS
jgi:hypothetical protein